MKSDSFAPDLYTDFPPKNENGTDGMLFLRTDTRELFVKEEGAWRSLGKLAQHGYHQVSFACAGSFPNAPYLNTGGTLDYTVTVEHYDTVNHEAIITITGNS